MGSFNRVILMGNLTRDPELRYVGGGDTAVCDIGLAITDRHKSAKGEIVESTTFVDVTFWARLAEVVNEYLVKGSPVLIEGRLKLDAWEKDGQKRSKLRVIAEKLQMLGDGKKGGSKKGKSPRGGDAYSESHDAQRDREENRAAYVTSQEGVPW